MADEWNLSDGSFKTTKKYPNGDEIQEWNLSDQVCDLHYDGGYYEDKFHLEDVSEFIKRLKEEAYDANCGGQYCDAGSIIRALIDKLAGDKLC